MHDSITQMRLSMRLEKYLSDYTDKNVRKDTLYRAEWDAAWHRADVARTQSILTPEMVDDVRLALNQLETTKGIPPLFFKHTGI
ncbi:hypothetical protein KDW_48680 [Dictyobacter vulcani]|uniref:Uncharacterized protein n=1 Tax=Dictyobacter vulcani TaxID=2607529 RepID=A0A5J4KZP8_9CHLR|nr:hypothetical protein [Dictyobacter vulcani]GER90706.1 hypothetical protein KDW_48680 [Dictyobacter vulcani]